MFAHIAGLSDDSNQNEKSILLNKQCHNTKRQVTAIESQTVGDMIKHWKTKDEKINKKQFNK